jgi:hypothetical protein
MRGRGFKPGVRRVVLVTIASALAVQSDLAHALPETWLDADLSFAGASSGARFGDALACSQASESTSQRSFIAVGAPADSEGAGRVYLYDVDGPQTPLQVLVPPSNVFLSEATAIPDTPTVSQERKFGAAVAFVSDINGDAIDDLVVGEPRVSPQGGFIHVYGSASAGSGVEYALCQSFGLNVSFGSHMIAMQGVSSAQGHLEKLVVSSPESGGTYGLDISNACGGTISSATRFTATNRGGGFGTSLAEVPDSVLGSGDGSSDLLVGQPQGGGGALGITYLIGSDQTETEFNRSEEAGYGSVVAGSYQSSFLGIASPARSGGRGGVDVFNGAAGIVCRAEPEVGEGVVAFGSSLAHLGTTFSSLFSSASFVTFAARSSEEETGGAISLFSFNGTDCSRHVRINNCISDPSQEQGRVIVGGVDCRRTRNGSSQPVLLFSSPGWNGEMGRVDAVSIGAEGGAPRSCSGGSNITPAPVDSTPIPTLTPTPTALPEMYPTPIEVAPGAGDLPAPSVAVSNQVVTITAPVATPKLTGAAYQAALKLLQRRGLSRRQAEQALRELTVSYIFIVKRSLFAEKVFPLGAEALGGRSSRSSLIRNRRNQVSLRGLSVGKYLVSYKIVVSTKKPRIDIGSTKMSKDATFRIR